MHYTRDLVIWGFHTHNSNVPFTFKCCYHNGGMLDFDKKHTLRIIKS